LHTGSIISTAGTKGRAKFVPLADDMERRRYDHFALGSCGQFVFLDGARARPHNHSQERSSRKGTGPMRAACLILLAVTALLAASRPPQALATAQNAMPAPIDRDGQHDFDSLIGSWKFHLKRLTRPLTGSADWEELDGTVICRAVWDGKANMEEVVLDGKVSQTHIQGLTLRLYSPTTHQWSLYWANAADGSLPMPPTVGHFNGHGRGEFYDHEDYRGRPIVVRYVWSNITATSAHFEEAFSADDGKTWEVNWITDQTRAGRVS
jgi:hypothetical protein